MIFFFSNLIFACFLNILNVFMKEIKKKKKQGNYKSKTKTKQNKTHLHRKALTFRLWALFVSAETLWERFGTKKSHPNNQSSPKAERTWLFSVVCVCSSCFFSSWFLFLFYSFSPWGLFLSSLHFVSLLRWNLKIWTGSCLECQADAERPLV